MIRFRADERCARAHTFGPITTSSVGVPVDVSLSKDFDGLAVTVCFRCGSVSADAVWYDGAEIVVPSQILNHAGNELMVGVYGALPDGTIVIPTVWASAGVVMEGARPSGVSPADPEPDWTAQVQLIASQAIEVANSVRSDADAGMFDGEAGPQGPQGIQGLAGADGYSPTATVTQTASGATITVTDKGGTTTATVHDGASGGTGPVGPAGADGFSPTVDVQTVDGGHEVTITDVAGAHSFDVLDGRDGKDGQTIYGTLSGNPSTTSDAYAAAPKALTMGGSSTQDGTPTPEAPVPIESVDALAVTFAGRNLLDPSLMKDQAAWNRIRIYMPAGTVLTMSTNKSAGSTNDLLAYFTNSGAQGSATIVTAEHSVTQTANADGYVEILQRRASGTDSFANYEWQVELGSTATSYEPYTATTLPIDLQSHELRSLPDGTRDELTVDAAGNVTLVQRVGVVDFDVATSANRNAAGAGVLTKKLPATERKYANVYTSAGDNLRGLSNRATAAQSSSSYLQPYLFDYHNTTGGLAIGFVAGTFASLEAANAWLAENPTYVCLKLLEPVNHDLGTVTLPALPAPDVTVWATGGSATPTLEVTYERDLGIVIANIEAQLAELATS